MLPAGYMAKHVLKKPDWLKADHVRDIYSVSGCVSRPFTDYIDFWKHNGYWFFDTPEIIASLAGENSLSLAGTALFYYEVYELEYREGDSRWHGFHPGNSFKTEVIVPDIKILEGFDIATFSAGASPECSPLSCNALAAEIKTNSHCLLESFDEAKQSLESGKFNHSEPGPFRIFAVYSAEWP
jgi:hypothetical protein